jgi:hypothetical protein
VTIIAPDGRNVLNVQELAEKASQAGFYLYYLMGAAGGPN